MYILLSNTRCKGSMEVPFDSGRSIGSIGEKRLIKEFIRPLFDGDHATTFLGNDCGVLDIGSGNDIVVSTDRVPADIIAFRLRVIGYSGLGAYLAVLNLSDLSAAGAAPIGLLLNLGLPPTLKFGELSAFCTQFKVTVEGYNGRVLGGDITASSELSVSASAIGSVPRGAALSRGGARPGDAIFITKSFGVTPAAFEAFLRLGDKTEVSLYREHLARNFVRPYAEIELGIALRNSGVCSSCMDNTDGYSECFYELSLESRVKFVLEEERILVPPEVLAVAEAAKLDAVEMGLRAGADFGLVGTVSDPAILDSLRKTNWPYLQMIGRVEAGCGVVIRRGEVVSEVARSGWNYFLK